MSGFDNPFTGIFTRLGAVAPEPHDPAVAVWSGSIPAWGARTAELDVGGAGWSDDDARQACIGEAVERLQPYRLPGDGSVVARFDDLRERAVPPERWVLFHREQYSLPGFPFLPFTRRSECRWVRFREAGSGEPCWVPAEMAYVFSSEPHAIAPSISTGLSCGRPGHPTLLRGLQEVIERDAAVGAWWGRYPLEEWDPREALAPHADRLFRPNLRYRCYRIDSPFSAHATIVTVEGEDRGGWRIAAGSACRESRAASWTKSALEAVHGYRYVRHLLAQDAPHSDPPADFSAHAAYYSRHPEKLAATVLRKATPARGADPGAETLPMLAERLGPDRPVLFRNMTPPGLVRAGDDHLVLRVVVPGLQPLHGNDALAQLGGPLWAPRGLSDRAAVPPHPFP